MVTQRFVVIALIAFVAILYSAKVLADDATEIRAVIDDQLTAFQTNDEARAFAHATPSIRQKFGSATLFMAMVRSAYQPLYRAQSYEFKPLKTDGETPVQAVRLTGQNGTISLALYQMERQSDGSWKIAGCLLVRLNEREI